MYYLETFCKNMKNIATVKELGEFKGRSCSIYLKITEGNLKRQESNTSENIIK